MMGWEDEKLKGRKGVRERRKGQTDERSPHF
jgi:hypothetical protein